MPLHIDTCIMEPSLNILSNILSLQQNCKDIKISKYVASICSYFMSWGFCINLDKFFKIEIEQHTQRFSNQGKEKAHQIFIQIFRECCTNTSA